MTTNNDVDDRWYSERDIVAQTGLAGPIVADLLPHLPTQADDYSTHARVYAADSIERARLADQMLRVGVRRHYIRAAIAEPMTADQIANGLAVWTALADSQPTNATTSTPHLQANRALLAATLALAAISVLLLGVITGFAISPA